MPLFERLISNNMSLLQNIWNRCFHVLHFATTLSFSLIMESVWSLMFDLCIILDNCGNLENPYPRMHRVTSWEISGTMRSLDFSSWSNLSNSIIALESTQTLTILVPGFFLRVTGGRCVEGSQTHFRLSSDCPKRDSLNVLQIYRLPFSVAGKAYL
jgi:hypothetical protein